MNDENKQKILVVDDAPANREMLGDVLKHDSVVIMAKDGRQGLEKAFAHRPDLILLDVMMPDLDGYEVLRRLRSDVRTANTGVIFITGMDRPEDEVEGLRAGASDYIAKPFNTEVVRARVALHLRLARQIHMLESLANIDPLTELPNRRQLDQVLESEWRRSQRSGQPLSVAMFDVDYFKQYNDAYGHATGDRALQAVARAVRNGMRRPADIAARYGGEEFVLVMPDTARAGALQLVDGLRQTVERLALPHAHSLVSDCLTVSAGVATCGSDGILSAAELLKEADKRLYVAKTGGRNRVQGD